MNRKYGNQQNGNQENENANNEGNIQRRKKNLNSEEENELEVEEQQGLNNNEKQGKQTLNIRQSLSENNNKINDIILAFFQIQATLRVSHFLSETYSDHKTLDKFLEKFNKKMDKFIEVWMGKHGRFDLGKNRQVNVYQINKDELVDYLDIVLKFLTGDSMTNSVYKLSKYPLKNIMNNKKNVDLMSIRDDIVKNINRMKYLLSFK